MDPKDEARQKIQAYLEQNKLRLIIMSASSVTIEVRAVVPGGRLLSESEVSSMVAVWQAINLQVPVAGASQSPVADSQFVESIKKAVTTVIDGVDIKSGKGRINISVTGVTAELKKGTRKLSLGTSWTGTLGLESQVGDFHLTGELSTTRWSVTLSYPDDTYIPDANVVGRVFGQGEKAMRNILSELGTFKNLNDISRIQKSVKPYMQPVKDAVDAAKGLAKTSGRRVSAGLTFGSPDPGPNEEKMPGGIQGQATLTVRF